MFTVRTCVFAAIFTLTISRCQGNTENNMHLLDNEINQALRDCKDGKQSHQMVKDEYEKQANLIDKIRSLVKRSDFQNDYESEEWDYGPRYPNNGKTWEDNKDDKSVMDSTYGQKRRNSSRNSHKNNEKSLREQNFTNYNNEDMGGSYDRGAKITNNYRKLNSNDGRTIKDPNSTPNYYDRFMDKVLIKRRKRNERLIKVANENECLSQCVFANIKIVDDRGIPKEALFTKLIRDSLASQQSRVLIEKQIQKCFKDLASEAEDNGCSYANMLDRCMGLQIRKREIVEKETN